MSASRKAIRFVRWRIPQFAHSVTRLLPSRRWAMVGALAAAVYFAVPYTPLSRWSSSALQSVVNDLKSRAAFQVIDDFASGVSESWDPAGLVADDSGAARVTGFAMHRNTMDLAGYRVDFDAKIASNGLGWFIGASDEQNYYAFKLEDVSSRRERRYRLVRYTVAQGEAKDADRVVVDLPVDLTGQEYNRISIRLRENRIATFINGTGVDYWQAEAPPQGGVGFFTENKESALVRRIEVSGNEDTWGLFLFGFLELIEDAKGFVEPISARFDSPPAQGADSTKSLAPRRLASAL